MYRTAFFSLILTLALAGSGLAQDAEPEPSSEAPSTTTATPVELTMVTATAIGQSLPFKLFEGEDWQAEATASQVKLHMYFAEPFQLSSIEAKPCAGYTFTSSASAYVNFDEQWVPLEITENPIIRGLVGSDSQGIEARSVTINFHSSVAPCLSELNFKGADGSNVPVRVPRRVGGNVVASSTLAPTLAYDAYKLFDSRYEYAWSSDGVDTGVHLDFSFDEPQRIERIALANGYQRSDPHCWKNSRPKTVQLSGDGGYSAELAIEDLMGTQVLELPTPFEGKNLRLTVTEAYSGKKWKDLLISELRFGDAEGWFLLSPFNHIQQSNKAYRAAFAKAGVEEILNQSLAGADFGMTGGGAWTLRLRSDGSVYVEGFNEEMGNDDMMTSESFFALGGYEVKETKGALKIKLFGSVKTLKEAYPMGMDCNGCGRDCNAATAPDGSKVLVFSDVLTIKRKGDGFVVSNVDKRRDLAFKTMEMTLD